MTSVPDIERFLSPKSIAVVGATDDIRKIGGQPIPALLGGGYKGEIFPVNPGRQSIRDLKCYPTLADIPTQCDLAVIAVPAVGVAQVMADCGRAKIRYAVVLSAGFGEVGEEGAKLQGELVEVARQAGVKIIGPNCQGFLNLKDRIFCGFGSGFTEYDAPYGSTALISQSGNMGLTIMSRAKRMDLGFHYVISSGNESMVSCLDLLEHFLEQDDLSSIAMYLEGVRDGRRLQALGRRAIEKRKPIIVWKCGNSRSGRKAAISHTSNVTASYEIYRAVFRQGGFVDVHSVDEMLSAIEAFRPGRLPSGRGVGVLASSGGFGVVSADACEASGLHLPELAGATTEILRKHASAFGSVQNPLDLPGQMSPANMNAITAAVLADSSVDQLIIRRNQIRGSVGREWAEGLVKIADENRQPIHVTLNPDEAQQALDIIRRSGAISLYTTAADAAEAASGASTLAVFAEKTRLPATYVAEDAPPRVAIEWSGGEEVLGEREAKQIFARYGVPGVSELFVPDQAVGELEGRQITFPVVAKLHAPDLHHKTEVGGVRLGLKDIQEVKDAYADMKSTALRKQPDLRIEGLLVQEMVQDGVEMIVGIVNDEHFGPVLALGLGGVFTEILKDVTHRLAPVAPDTVRVMLGELKGSRLLAGARGRPPADVDALCEAVSAISHLAWDHREVIGEIDVNPLFVRPSGKGVAAADGLIAIRGKSNQLQESGNG